MRGFTDSQATLPPGTVVCFPKGIRPLKNGATIEQLYHIGIKGYGSVEQGMGKPWLSRITPEQEWLFYYELWATWATINSDRIGHLFEQSANSLTQDPTTALQPAAQALATILAVRSGTLQTKVVHLKRELFDINIGRPGVWGNPFSHIADKQTLAQHLVASREQAITAHRRWLLYQPALLVKLRDLNGKILGCWCAPQPCHGHTLAEFAERFPG